MIRILVSCDSETTDFKECIRRICDESKAEFEYHYVPDEVAPLTERNRLDRMLELVRESDIVFMDVTPRKFSRNGEEKDLTNQGVLIEYGVLISCFPYEQKLKIFCESAVSRSLLHPYFLKTVHSYSLKELNDESSEYSLRRQVKAIIADYRERLPELTRKLLAENEAYKAITRIKERS